ncbi:hypothetical protein PUN28_006863 [Cardiocondyla obscurior]
MCDLIDLNSPNVRGAFELAKLASPLIPAPRHIRRDETDTQPEKREDDDNNPFDQVLHETAEYVSKKNDPFEVMLQQALRSKARKKKKGVNFADDFTPKSKKRYFKTMNKTLNMLDDSSLESRFDLFDGDKKETKMKTEIDTRNTDICDNNVAASASITKEENNVSTAESEYLPETLELSILNKSVMNDTLLEAFPMCKKSNKISFEDFSPEKDKLFEEYTFSFSNIKHIKPHSQRSLSQGAEKSPSKLLYLNKRAMSVADSQKSVLQSSESCLDKAFLISKLSEQSVFSNLSNVSSITKCSTFLSNNTMNRAFLDDSSVKTSQEEITAAESSAEIKPKYNLSDLTERFNKLKSTMSDMSISSINDGSNSTKEEDNKENKNNKLIDVDVFMPEGIETFNKSSSSTSSDSVFTTNKINKSILNEAKVLAKTFEELSSKPDSLSADDDLLSNNTLWMSELLPAFEEIPVAHNLIDLPVSPEGNSKDITYDDKKQSSTSTDSGDENFLKKLESPFTDNVAVQQDVTSLLSNLREIIKTENNAEAKKLLDNLENVLDINCKNNTELLVTYLNTSNKSSSQQISLDEKFNNLSIDKSKEENGKITPEEKFCNNEKSNVNHASEAVSRCIVNRDKSSVTSLSCEDDKNRADRANTPDSTKHNKHVEEKDNHVDKKIAIELLINLKKLLNGQAKDDTTMELLKNIGKALKTALNDNNENEMQTNCIVKQNVQQTTPVRTSESGRNSVKVTHRRSLESKPKSFEKIVRKSISTIELLPKNKSGTQIRGRTSEVENHQKLFLCNSGPAESTVSDSKKEKFSIMSDVKNKLKKRSDVTKLKGPMKAMHPVNDMQKKRASLGKQTLSSQIGTSPKSNKTTPLGNKIISSTPNSDNQITRKGTKSKPIASSTPDGQKNKSLLSTSTTKKRNFSCDISPVTAYVNMNGSDERKDNSKKMSKLPTPKKCTTPTRQRMDANGIPKFLTPPRNYSSLNKNNSDRLNKSFNFQRYSPVSGKIDITKTQQSPLKESNRISAKVKPFNLISKIKRHSTGDFTEKENNY